MQRYWIPRGRGNGYISHGFGEPRFHSNRGGCNYRPPMTGPPGFCPEMGGGIFPPDVQRNDFQFGVPCRNTFDIHTNHPKNKGFKKQRGRGRGNFRPYGHRKHSLHEQTACEQNDKVKQLDVSKNVS